MLGRFLFAPLHEHANSSGCGVELRDAVALDDVPHAIFTGRIGSAFVQHRRRAIYEWSIDDVAMTSHPTNVG